MRRRRTAAIKTADLGRQCTSSEAQEDESEATTSAIYWNEHPIGTLRGGADPDSRSSNRYQCLSALESGEGSGFDDVQYREGTANPSAPVAEIKSPPPTQLKDKGTAQGKPDDPPKNTILLCMPDSGLGRRMVRLETPNGEDWTDKELVKQVKWTYFKKRILYIFRKLTAINVRHMYINSNESVGLVTPCGQHGRFSLGPDCTTLKNDVEAGRYRLGSNLPGSGNSNQTEVCLCKTDIRLTSTFLNGSDDKCRALFLTTPRFVGDWVDPKDDKQVMFWGLLIEESRNWLIIGCTLFIVMGAAAGFTIAWYFGMKEDLSNGLAIGSFLFSGLSIVLAYMAL